MGRVLFVSALEKSTVGAEQYFLQAKWAEYILLLALVLAETKGKRLLFFRHSLLRLLLIPVQGGPGLLEVSLGIIILEHVGIFTVNLDFLNGLYLHLFLLLCNLDPVDGIPEGFFTEAVENQYYILLWWNLNY